MKFARYITFAAIAAASTHNSCSTPAESPARPAQVIYVPETYNFQFDARRGDTVIVILNPDSESEMLNRCDDMGGELIANPFTQIWTCESVDF